MTPWGWVMLLGHSLPDLGVATSVRQPVEEPNEDLLGGLKGLGTVRVSLALSAPVWTSNVDLIDRIILRICFPRLLPVTAASR